MIWHGETEKQREAREARGIRCFAWLPTKMSDGPWVWWEHYWRALHRGINNRQWWVRTVDKQDCIQRAPTTPPPPRPTKPSRKK